MDDLEGIKQIEEQAKAMVESLKPLQDQANSIVESMKPIQQAIMQISETVKPIQTQIQETASAVLPIQEELKKEALQMQNKVRPLFDKVSIKLEEINSLQEQATQTMNKFNEITSQIQNFYDNTFSPIKEVVDNPENWLEKTFENAQDSLNDIVSMQEEIVKYKWEIETTKKFLDELSETNKILKSDLEEMLGTATDKSLSKSFDEEIKNLESERKVWKYSFLGLLLVFLWISIYTVITFEWSINDYLVKKISLWISIAIVDFVIYREYAKYNRKIDLYSFKKTIASTLNTYQDLLKSKFTVIGEWEEELKRWRAIEDKILDFVLETMKSIYREPQSDKSSELELKAKIQAYELSFKNTNSEKKTKKEENELQS